MKLERLAARHGVARSYRTDRGERVDVDRDTIVAVLEALGVDTNGRGWIARAARRFDEAAAERLIEPVLVAWDGRLPATALDGRLSDVAITLEDGTLLEGEAARGERSAALPPGYHRLIASDGTREAEALVISAPVRVWRAPGPRKHFGVYAPVFALHHHDEPGPGHLGHLAELLEWVVHHGGDTVLTLPLLATFLDEPLEVSPYSPVSRLMWNELFATLDRPTADTAPDELIDYHGAAIRTREAITRRVREVDDDPLASGDVLRFLAERPDVLDYARFRAAQQRYGRNWRTWPQRLRDGTIEAADVDPREVRYHCVAQWLVDRQIGALGAQARERDLLLGLDLTIGTHPDGFDVWRREHEFALNASVGAPPDAFFVGGQDWGFPPLDPAAARASGHEYLRQSLAHHLRHATMLRVDHVMGLDRVYWIPHGAPPTSGTYVAYPAEEQFAILSLESHRARSVVVGEDLGTVPPSIRRAMRRHSVIGTWVAQAALEDVPERGDYERPARRTVASLNTHDMPTFAGFADGVDIDDRVDLGQIDADTGRRQHEERARLIAATKELVGATDRRQLLDALIEQLGGSDATIVLVNLEDLWLEPRSQNVPGTSTERPNWRRPIAHGVDVLDEVPGVGATMERLRAARSRTRNGTTGRSAQS